MQHLKAGRQLQSKLNSTLCSPRHSLKTVNQLPTMNANGVSISYDMVERIITSIAAKLLCRYAENDNIFIPQSMIPGRFVQFSADNFDLLEETLDGKDPLHVTQMVAFQRGKKNRRLVTMTPPL